MKVYICPKCGWIRVVSRRKDVECFKCKETQMTVAKISYEKIGQMTKEEREDYARTWLYLHGEKTDKRSF